MLVLDADALIKLNRAGVLDYLSRAFSCVIPPAVHHEAIAKGREHGHADADAIEVTVSEGIPIKEASHPAPAEPGLGRGDVEVIGLALENLEAIVVSDDRRLLASLVRAGRPFVTTAGAIAVLAARDALTSQYARKALDELRPYITRESYEQALAIIEGKEISL